MSPTTDFDTTSIEELDAEDLLSLIDEFGGQVVFDMMYETGDEFTDFGRMALAATVAGEWINDPTSVNDERLEFLTTAVRKDNQLWTIYYMSEKYENVPPGAFDGRSFGISGEEHIDSATIEAAQTAGMMGEKSGIPILNEAYEWAYRPEFYTDLTPEWRNFSIALHGLLDPVVLGQAGITAGDERLDRAVLHLRVRDGKVTKGEYREQGIWNAAGNVLGDIAFGTHGDLAAHPDQWIPKAFGGDPQAEMNANIRAYLTVITAGVGGKGDLAKGIARLPQAGSKFGVIATEGGPIAAHFTVPAEYFPSLMSQQMAYFGSTMRGVSGSQWWRTTSDAASKTYRALARYGAGGTLVYGSATTALDQFRNLADADMVTGRENGSIATVEVTRQQADFLQLPRAAGPGPSLADGTPIDHPSFYGPGVGSGAGPGPFGPLLGMTDQQIAGEDLAGAAYLDNPYVGFEDITKFDTPGGVPDVAQRRAFTSGISPMDMRGDGTPTRMSLPTYRTKDIENTLRNMNPGDLEWFQAKAIEANLINDNAWNFTPGSYRDEHTLGAMETLMYNANRSDTEWGQDWRNQLTELARLGREAEAEDDGPSRRFVKAAFLKPDPAELAQWGKEAIRQGLGRDINDWELEMISENLLAGKRAQHDAEQEALHQNFLATGRAIEEDLGYAEAADVQDVDWSARASELVESKFKNEFERAKRTEEVREGTTDLMGGLRRGIAAMGG